MYNLGMNPRAKPWYKSGWAWAPPSLLGLFLVGSAFDSSTPVTQNTYDNTTSIGEILVEDEAKPVLTAPKARLQEPQCHPSYSGCLKPNASDYDCAGGSGNGPYYTGLVQVYGYDEYDLDRDNDGWGCE